MSGSKWFEKPVTIRLTPYQRQVLWSVVDGAMDAGACEDGLTPKEARALGIVNDMLIGHRVKRSTSDDEIDDSTS